MKKIYGYSLHVLASIIGLCFPTFVYHLIKWSASEPDESDTFVASMLILISILIIVVGSVSCYKFGTKFLLEAKQDEEEARKIRTQLKKKVYKVKRIKK